MRKKRSVLLLYLIISMLFLSACYKQKEIIEKKVEKKVETKIDNRSLIDVLSEQLTDNSIFCYVVNSDRYILKADIPKLLEILKLENWKNVGKASDEKTSKDIIINFNEFPEGENEKTYNFDIGTPISIQLVIQAESNIAFNGYSAESDRYILNSAIINELKTFISKKAISLDKVIARMK